MSVNSTSSSDGLLVFFCSKSESMVFMSVAMVAGKTILVLPLCVCVLYLGHQRRQQQRQHQRQQRSFKAPSHSDFFTYHLSLIELFWAFGWVCFISGKCAKKLEVILLGMSAISMTFFGEIIFHLLTCVEWYLAVVHPITYLKLRAALGERIRNVSIGCVWLLCFGLISLHVDPSATYVNISVFCVLVVAIIGTSFCSFSVLWALIRPGPSKGGGEKVDQPKLRAFQTITVISGVLWMWFLGLLVSNALNMSPVLSEDVGCMLMAGINWLSLPTSLVAPLFYLQRAGKLPCSCFNRE